MYPIFMHIFPTWSSKPSHFIRFFHNCSITIERSIVLSIRISCQIRTYFDSQDIVWKENKTRDIFQLINMKSTLSDVRLKIVKCPLPFVLLVVYVSKRNFSNQLELKLTVSGIRSFNKIEINIKITFEFNLTFLIFITSLQTDTIFFY
jgi:hypothetical protein